VTFTAQHRGRGQTNTALDGATGTSKTTTAISYSAGRPYGTSDQAITILGQPIPRAGGGDPGQGTTTLGEHFHTVAARPLDRRDQSIQSTRRSCSRAKQMATLQNDQLAVEENSRPKRWRRFNFIQLVEFAFSTWVCGEFGQRRRPQTPGRWRQKGLPTPTLGTGGAKHVGGKPRRERLQAVSADRQCHCDAGGRRKPRSARGRQNREPS